MAVPFQIERLAGRSVFRRPLPVVRFAAPAAVGRGRGLLGIEGQGGCSRSGVRVCGDDVEPHVELRLSADLARMLQPVLGAPGGLGRRLVAVRAAADVRRSGADVQVRAHGLVSVAPASAAPVEGLPPDGGGVGGVFDSLSGAAVGLWFDRSYSRCCAA